MAITNKVLEFVLELTPGGVPPIIHASQGDVGRTFKANIIWNGSAASAYISGTTVNLRGKKPDKTVFDYTATVDGSSVTFATTEQMTIISGPVECELVFFEGSNVVATANFILVVEESPFDPNAISESEVTGLNAMIQAATPEAVDEWFETEAPTSPEFAAAMQDATDAYLDEHGVAVDYASVKNAPIVEYTAKTNIEEIAVTHNSGYMDVNGHTGATSQYFYTQNIPVREGDTITVRNDDTGAIQYLIRYLTVFDDTGAAIPAKGITTSFRTYTVEEGVSSIVLTINNIPNVTVIRGSGSYTISDLAENRNTKSVIEKIGDTFELVPNSIIKEIAITKTPGYMQANGAAGAASQYIHTQPIPVSAGDVITVRNDDTGVTPRQMRYVTALDENFPVTEAGSDTAVSSYTVPDGISYVIVTIDNNANPNSTILKSTSAYSFRHGEKTPSIVLPKKSVAVVGHEWNLYYDNIIDGLTDEYYVFCSGINGKSYGRFLRFTPASGDVGTHTVTVGLYSKSSNELITAKSFVLQVVADTAPTKKVVFIGDSLTAAAVYVKEVQDVLSGGSITSIGTITSGGVNHEGRSGWSAYDYTEQSGRNGVTNAFWNPSTSKFDFSYYMSNNGFSGVDCVMLNLGTNGVEYTERTCNAIAEMTESIHTYDSNIKVIVSLITPPATQDGCGQHNGMFNANGYKHNELKLNAAYIEQFDEVENNVFVSEPYFNIDRLLDFATTTIPASSRNPETITVQNNNVHPNSYGYLKMADVYYNNLLYRL